MLALWEVSKKLLSGQLLLIIIEPGSGDLWEKSGSGKWMERSFKLSEKGFAIARGRRVPNIIVETDSENVFRWIDGSHMVHHPLYEEIQYCIGILEGHGIVSWS